MSFETALRGLNAASSHLDITANNIANVNTTGFKGSRASFADVYASSTGSIDASSAGQGVKLAAQSQQFAQGDFEYTSNNLDLAINGDGFFVLGSENGLSYTRAGAFSIDKDGFVVNQSNKRLQAYPAALSGQVLTGSLQDLQISSTESPAQATEMINLGMNLNADAVIPTAAFDPSLESSYNHERSFQVYDSLGNQHRVTSYFIKTDDSLNQWQQHLYINDDMNNPLGEQTLLFDSQGRITSPLSGSSPVLTYNLNNGADDLSLTVDMSQSTQYNSDFGVTTLEQDGYPTGSMVGLGIDASGTIAINYNNGKFESLGKIAVASFPNASGLQPLDETEWQETVDSGQALNGEASFSGLGAIQSGALERSNVDLTAQLVEMITAQRNFEANSQMISTTNEVTKTILNMR